VCREVRGFLLSEARSLLINGDLVSQELLEAQSSQPQPLVEDLDAQNSVESADAASALTTASHEAQLDEILSLRSAEMSESAMQLQRKANYVAVAGQNEERSLESIVVHLSGALVVTIGKDALGKAFYVNHARAVAIVRQAGVEWLVSGFVVATAKDGSQATLWRGLSSETAVGGEAGMSSAEWFDLDATVEDEISVCIKVPDSWAKKTFYGIFPDRNAQEDDSAEAFEEPPQYVLSVPGNLNAKTVVTFELLNDLNYIENTGMDIYAVNGEEYEACDDPKAFWTRDFLVKTCIPALKKSSLTGIELVLESDKVYMLVPFCSQPLHFCIRVASEYNLDSFDLATSNSDDDSDVGSLY